MCLRLANQIRFLRYTASALFCGIALAGLDVSSDTASLQDAGLVQYLEPVNVQVSWFDSKACLVLPPDNSLTNCTTLASVRVLEVFTILLIAVLVAYAMLRRRARSMNRRGTHAERSRRFSYSFLRLWYVDSSTLPIARNSSKRAITRAVAT
jgi:hypothetical protein